MYLCQRKDTLYLNYEEAINDGCGSPDDAEFLLAEGGAEHGRLPGMGVHEDKETADERMEHLGLAKHTDAGLCREQDGHTTVDGGRAGSGARPDAHWRHESRRSARTPLRPHLRRPVLRGRLWLAQHTHEDALHSPGKPTGDAAHPHRGGQPGMHKGEARTDMGGHTDERGCQHGGGPLRAALDDGHRAAAGPREGTQRAVLPRRRAGLLPVPGRCPHSDKHRAGHQRRGGRAADAADKAGH